MAEELKGSVAEQAKEKLMKDLNNHTGAIKAFLKPIVDHLIKRAGEDEGMAQDILQEFKNLSRLNDYIRKKAREYGSGSCVAVEDYIVYEWAEDYIRLDDKELAEKDKKEKEAREAKQKKEREDAAEKKAATAVKKPVSKPAVKKAEQKPKPKKDNSMEGQLSLFDLMGA